MLSLPVTAYRIGIVCALPKELTAVAAVLDEEHASLTARNAQDPNTYVLGRVHQHNVVVACLPAGIPGTNAAAVVASNMLRSFPGVRIGLLVGIGGGIPRLPKTDIRLGDVVVSEPDSIYGGVVQYDLGKSLKGGVFERKGSLDKPPMVLLTALSLMKSKSHGIHHHLEAAYSRDPTLAERGYEFPGVERDELYCSTCDMFRSECGMCEDGLILRSPRTLHHPIFHYGTIASGNQVIKDATLRDRLGQEFGAKCVEMEAAGMINDFRFLVVRGICDYADSYKTDDWQGYAALTAAAGTKELLSYVVPNEVDETAPLKEVIGVMTQVLDEIRQQNQKTETTYLNDLHRKCHQAFKTTTYEEYKNINPQRVPDTCQWVLQHRIFQRWHHSCKDDLLWISADPGCGKSVLARSLIDIDFLEKDYKVCYFFFKDNEVQNNLSAAFCALLHQLFGFAPQLIQYAIPFWERNAEKQTLEVDELWRIFLAATEDSNAPGVICVLDALDECRESDRRNLIRKLTEFYKKSMSRSYTTLSQPRGGHVKFLVTGRPYSDIRIDFQLPIDLPSIQLRGEHENEQIKKEINMVIKQRVNKVATDLGLKDQTKDRLKKELLAMEHRTYLWLYLAIDSVYETFRDSFRPDEESIERLPTGIYDAYEKILSRASKRRQNVKLVLQIIVGARRPLTVGEMAIALGLASKPDAVTLKDAILDTGHLARNIRDWCGLFVFVSDFKIYLIHQTAREFLVQSPQATIVPNTWKHCLKPAETEQVMSQLCVNLLLLPDMEEFADRFFARRLSMYKWETLIGNNDTECFVIYSATNWADHVSNTCSPLNESLRARVLKLYDDNEMAFDRYCWILHCLGVEIFEEGDATVTGLDLAARNNHQEIVSTLLEEEDPVVRQPNEITLAVIWASEFGHSDIVKLLVNKRPEILSEGNRYGTFARALIAASQNGHLVIVELLLNEGPKVKAEGRYSDALVEASQNGHLAVVELLINRRADVNTSERSSTALAVAAMNGHQAIVELLINKGADVKAKGMRYVLLWAKTLEEDRGAMVKLLITKGISTTKILRRRQASASTESLPMFDTITNHIPNDDYENGDELEKHLLFGNTSYDKPSRRALPDSEQPSRQPPCSREDAISIIRELKAEEREYLYPPWTCEDNGSIHSNNVPSDDDNDDDVSSEWNSELL